MKLSPPLSRSSLCVYLPRASVCDPHGLSSIFLKRTTFPGFSPDIFLFFPPSFPFFFFSFWVVGFTGNSKRADFFPCCSDTARLGSFCRCNDNRCIEISMLFFHFLFINFSIYSFSLYYYLERNFFHSRSVSLCLASVKIRICTNTHNSPGNGVSLSSTVLHHRAISKLFHSQLFLLRRVACDPLLLCKKGEIQSRRVTFLCNCVAPCRVEKFCENYSRNCSDCRLNFTVVSQCKAQTVQRWKHERP